MTKPPFVARLISAALRIQDTITPDVPETLKAAGAGRKGKLVVEGEGGGIFYLKWDGKRLVQEFDDSNVRNTFTLHSQTVIDIATGLDIREAVGAGLIRVDGDRSIYDEEDIIKLFEQLQHRLAAALKSIIL